jgi:co-chaperonin GroES (HSP10)
MKKEVNVIPGLGKLLVTADKETVTNSGVIISAGGGFEYKDRQRIVAIGQDCPEYLKENDIVVLNKYRYRNMKYSEDTVRADINGNYITEYILPIEVIDGREYMLLDSFGDIKYIYPVNEAHFTAEELAERQGIIPGIPIVS